MLQRLIAAILGVLGLAAIALGVASATVWRPDDTLTARATSADGTTLMTTAPGVLELGDPPVTVRATAPDGAHVVLAFGRDTDVTAWIGEDPHTVVTGLRDWDTLATDAVTEPGTGPAEDESATDEATDAATDPAPDEATPALVPSPAGSDLWVEQKRGDGTAEHVWTPREGRWTLLAASTGEDPGPVTLELSWPRTVTTPWLVPGVVGGAVLLLVAGLLALRARRAARRGRAADAGAAGSAAGARTRRERREAASAAAGGADGGEDRSAASAAGEPGPADRHGPGTPSSGGATTPADEPGARRHDATDAEDDR